MKFWLMAAAMIVGMSAMAPDAALAQGGARKNNTCPGGISACIQRCIKGGGQPHNCPRWCERQRGC